jgi:hypothetical protein
MKTPVKKLERNKYKRARRKHWINLYKTSKGCVSCGYNHSPYALDLDHVDASSKIQSPSRMFLWTLKKLMQEIRKCQVMCRNCHGIKSATEELRKVKTC